MTGEAGGDVVTQVSASVTWRAVASLMSHDPRCVINAEKSMDKIPTDTWVVVADGSKARMFRNVGEGMKVSLKQRSIT
jgi:hypothetical protein